MEKCPCCSGLDYNACCKPYHDGTPAPTPLALMRSRYSAYALHKADYIMKTTHPRSPHYEKDRRKWKEAILTFTTSTRFIKLEIISTTDDTVQFIAHLEQNGNPIPLKEHSLFQKVDHQWYYLKAL